MLVEASVTIKATRQAVWNAIASIENANAIITGIERVEMVEKPAHGLVGMRWKETRTLFGKPATVEKWITDAVDNESYRTRAESVGFVFLTTMRVSGSDGVVTLTSSHDSKPQTFVAKVSATMMFLFKGSIRTAILKDLDDIRGAVERQQSPQG